MKISFIKYLLICVLWVAGPLGSMAQAKPKPPQKTAAQKEMEAMVKELEAELKDMEPEERKEAEKMLRQMRQMPGLLPLAEKQMAADVLDMDRFAPSLQASRMASFPKTVIGASGLPAYASNLQERIGKKLKPEILAFMKNYQQLLARKYPGTDSVQQASIGLLLMGQPVAAGYLMAGVVQTEPSNGNAINNLAAMLNMGGAEHAALPLLQYLNAKYKLEYAVLNNLGMAFWGLGDLTKAQNYLDSALALNPGLATARHAKGLAQAEKGNKTGAISQIKQSMQDAYLPEKQSQLQKLGYRVKFEDIHWDPKANDDPLGLDAIDVPAYPVTPEESEKLEPVWDTFNKEIGRRKDEQEEMIERLTPLVEEQRQKRLEDVMAGNGTQMMPMMREKAMAKLQMLRSGDDPERIIKRMQDAQSAWIKSVSEPDGSEDELDSELKRLNRQFAPLFGEGKENPFEQACAAYTSAYAKFLSKANPIAHKVHREYKDAAYRWYNMEYDLLRYAMWPEEAELEKAILRLNWLSLLQTQKVYFKGIPRMYCLNTISQGKKWGGKLADFYDKNCPYETTFSVPCIGSHTERCNKATTTVAPCLPLPAGARVNAGWTENNETGQFNGSVEVGAGVGLGEKVAGPVKVSAGAGGAVKVEFTNDGIKNVILKGGVGLNMSSTEALPGAKATVAGINGEISLMSGPSMGAKIFGKDL